MKALKKCLYFFLKGESLKFEAHALRAPPRAGRCAAARARTGATGLAYAARRAPAGPRASGRGGRPLFRSLARLAAWRAPGAAPRSTTRRRPSRRATAAPRRHPGRAGWARATPRRTLARKRFRLGFNSRMRTRRRARFPPCPTLLRCTGAPPPHMGPEATQRARRAPQDIRMAARVIPTGMLPLPPRRARCRGRRHCPPRVCTRHHMS